MLPTSHTPPPIPASLPPLAFAQATAEDALAIAELRTATARELTARYGIGHWSGQATERGVIASLRDGPVWVIRAHNEPVATFRLGTRKPWAIDPAYFTPCKRPLYLTDMAVQPEWQRRGVGRRCVEEMLEIGRARPADAIRLDAYDTDAGAGEFYRRCGFVPTGAVVYRRVPLLYFERML
jgi:ribosomal protein S18 acetylase RimI-like enzyme